MPELPEVEKLRRDLSHQVINKKIACFKVLDPAAARGDQALFLTATQGSYIKWLDRLGRYLLVKLASGYYLFIYLSTTGQLIYETPAAGPTSPLAKSTRIIIEFENGSKILFNDARGYGYFKILDDQQRKRLLVTLGSDATAKTFTYAAFVQLLRNKRTSLQNFLINDQYLSGIGSDYQAKICLEARVAPEKGIKELSQAEIKRLYKAISKVLKKGYK
ncbi:hypothetical protein COZ84_03555 [Candidatus Kuenenbacteria bacterium CG_4_8_14_3_um_filter_39_15]|uniref:Formamidopyrimidine-DNA glycosylase catalytic domain-containing protein n=4 Tax=Candidatus Kueneniibacteriota TaxID=1752740 RepID=A0A2M7IKX5_9BACT|nr:hypothetical protein [Candidatus Kuenenbacteria bacterium]PIP76004.1 MAG: hypothetical protein COW86_00550 [Candidatus Kuenenbacteria bacterium CG22_combo_CG10-13_8_21_14_all_39_9]PIW95430.1 MAG: hypothetical protein COZ84_03555 [Candidatus Kuenenbacteria bacterium CG_4_8_14_3_um_filter_39_15]PIX92106.1 MAG: hypothetical protein COZ26_03610 [Candidatus Kuenenbacteria bacterium CG_4_10_14_3_um_filter_39_14]